MIYRLWRLANKLHHRHQSEFTWGLRFRLGAMAEWERGSITWRDLYYRIGPLDKEEGDL